MTGVQTCALPISIPNTEANAEFSLLSVHFSNLINQLKLFGSDLNINCSEEEITLCANSPESGKMQVNIDIAELSEYSIDEGSSLKMSFSLSCLHNICAYNKQSKEIQIRLTADQPLQVIYLIGGDPDARLRIYLAPKISDD